MGLGALFGGRSGLDEAADQVALDFAHGGAAAVLCGGGDGVHARRGGGVGAAAVQGCSAVPIADGDYDVLSAAVCPTHTMYSVVHCRGRNVPALVTYLTQHSRMFAMLSILV